MTSIADIKAQYPELADSDDDQVVDVMHQAYYADRSRDEVAKALGVKPAEPKPEKASKLRRYVADPALSLLQGAVEVPKMAVGLADMATGGRVGKFLENEGGAIGFRPNEASQILEGYKSDEQKAASAAVAGASEGEGGFVDKVGRVAKAVVQNPSVVPHAVLQSLPSMGAGGVIGRGALAIAPRLGVLAGGVGEGIAQMGSQAEDIRTDASNTSRLLTGEQSMIAGASGAATGLIGAFSGRLAKRLGFETPENLMLGIKGDAVAQRGIVKQVLGAAATEGFLEELPQSVQEQVATNLALGKPLDEGVDQAAVLGVFTGAAMGGGAHAMFHGKPAAPLKTAGDLIREDLQPGGGPLAKAANAGVLNAAAEADAKTPPPGTAAPVTVQPADADTIAAIRALPPEQQAAVLKQQEIAAREDIDPAVRAAAQARVKVMLGEIQKAEDPTAPKVEPTGPVVAPGAPGNETDQALARIEKEARDAEKPADASTTPGSDVQTAEADANAMTPEEAQAQRERDRPPAEIGNPLPGDILTKTLGIPFRSMAGAMTALQQAGGEATHTIVRVKQGLVVRPKEQTNGAVGSPAVAGSDGGAAPAVAAPSGRVDPVANAGGSDGGTGGSVAAPDAGAGAPVDAVRGGEAAAPALTTRPQPTTLGASMQAQPAGTRGTGAADVAPKRAGAPGEQSGSGSAAPAPATSAPAQQLTPEIVEQPHADPQRVPGDRWQSDRGAMPGEPMAFLDGDEDTAKAVMVQIETPGKGVHYEVRAVGGRLIASGSTAAETAKLAEKAIDTPPAKEKAVDRIKRLKAEKAAATAPAPAPAPAARPKRRAHPVALRGSIALAEISAQLGGISPDLLADLSEKRVITRTSKLGKKTEYTAWDNPPAAGVGPLFRKGGTGDLSEIAMVLEQAGFLTPGSVEADPVGATQRAQEIIKAELAKGGSTLAVGNADAIDAEMSARRDAAMDDGPDPWDSFEFTPDDLEASGYDELDPVVRDLTEGLVQEAEELGLDTYALREQAVRLTADQSDAAYHAEAQSILGQAIAQAREEAGRRDAGADRAGGEGRGETAVDPGAAGSVGQADRPDLALTAPTAAEVVAEQDRRKAADAADAAEQKRLADKAKADATRDEFTLTGSDRPADVAAAAGQGDLLGEPAAAPSKFAGNTVFTEDAVAKARAVLKRKLGTINSGIDPELLQAGLTLAGAHIEAGARSFTAFARAMVADLGDAVRPYLKSWYMAMKFDPRAAAFAGDMSKSSEVEDADADASFDEPAPAPTPAPEPVTSSRQAGMDAWNAPGADRKEMLRAAGYTDGDQQRVFAQFGWTALPEAARRKINDAASAAPGTIDAAAVDVLTSEGFEQRADGTWHKSVGKESDIVAKRGLDGADYHVTRRTGGKGGYSKLVGSAGVLRVVLREYERALMAKEAEAAPTPEAAPAPASGPQIVEHVTGKGKTLRGVVRTDLTPAQAKTIDAYTFKKDGGQFIREAHLHALNEAFPEPATAPAPTMEDRLKAPENRVTFGDIKEAESADTLTGVFKNAIAAGRMPKDNPALRKMVELFDGKPADQARMKEAQEDLEAAIAAFSRDIVAQKEGPRSTFNILTRLYASQPNLNIRTSTSIANQAYSTPAPLAFLASELAGIKHGDAVLEPTAGTGMLLMGATKADAVVNELNDYRAALLREQGYKVTQKDATTERLAHVNYPVDVVITNPPFGPIKNAAGESIKVKVDGYTLGQIDHLIAARALESLKDDGRAVLIIGANKAAGQQSNNDLIFFNWLYGNYRVTSHFEVEGDLYQRQGAGWPVRVITIQGRLRSNTTAPDPATISRASTWEQVYDQYEQGVVAGRSARGTEVAPVRPGVERNDGARPVSEPAGNQAERLGASRPTRGTSGAGNVAGVGAGTVADRGVVPEPSVGSADRPHGRDEPAVERPDPVGRVEPPARTALDAAGNPRSTGLTSAENAFQAAYIPRSSRKDEGVLIPVNMMGPTQAALDRLEDRVGDIDHYLKAELGYESVEDLHRALMGLQVDSVASAIEQIKQDKGTIIADQTGIGKGRQAAAIIRWAERAGFIPVFVTVKPSLFSDMHGDLTDIGSTNIAPLIVNSTAWVTAPNGDKLFANKPSTHTATLKAMAAGGGMPAGRNAVFMTYSQINVENTQRAAIEAIADRAVFVLDEAHNAAGESATGDYIKNLLSLAKGTVYLSATYAKRPDNMPLYFKTDIGAAAADDDTLMAAMAAGGLPLQTVVANNLVKAGQMFRRERSYDGVSIETRDDTAHKAEHTELSDRTTEALRAIVHADRMFHEGYFKALKKAMEKEGARAIDNAGNQAKQSVDHTQFTSVVHNFVKQMLLGLKAQTAADEAIATLKRNEKPLIAVENTMGSFLQEYVADNGIRDGDPLGTFDYRNVLSRALARSRFVTIQTPAGDKVKKEVSMAELAKVAPEVFATYQASQRIIDGLNIGEIPVSPIDWMRQKITEAGYSVAEITGRSLSVDYSDPKAPKLSQLSAQEQKDKVKTTRRFNNGELDAIILNVAGSTGISLHASERFSDQRIRHMIVAQAAGDINIVMQMLGRIHRTGQVVLPKYMILNADLPAEKRPTAILSGKMKSLNANTSSNTESATSVKSLDMLNKYGDAVVYEYLGDNPELAMALGIEVGSSTDEGATGPEDVARTATGRMALMPVKQQQEFYDDVEEQYATRIEYLNKTNQNELEPRTFDFDAREVKTATIFEGQDPTTPFGEDATYGEYSVKAQGKPMTPVEIRAAITENLGGKTAQEHSAAIIAELDKAYGPYAAKATAMGLSPSMGEGRDFIQSHQIGQVFRLDVNGDAYNAIVTNIRTTHKINGNPFAMSKIQVTVAVNGALRGMTVPGSQFSKIQTSAVGQMRGNLIEQYFAEGPKDEREVAKIVTGNLLGAYGELANGGTRGSIITFTKADGTTEQGILLPKAFNFAKDISQDYRIKTPEQAFKYLQTSQHENIEKFGIMSRDNVLRVLPNGLDGVTVQVPKSKAKGGRYFLDKKLLAVVGDFFSSGNYMRASVSSQAKAEQALRVLMDKQALYVVPSMAEDARTILNDPKEDKPMASRSVEQTRARIAAAVGIAPERPGERAAAVESLANRIASNWANPPPIVVLLSLEDPLAPPELKREDDLQRSEGAKGDAEGFFYDGTVYLIADKLPGDADVLRVLMHEALGHYGLRGVFGKDLVKILDDMSVLNAAKVRDKAKQYKLDYEKQKDRRKAAEEVLAEFAQRNPEIGWAKRAIAAIKTWLRTHVPGFRGMKFSDAEIVRNFIEPARNYVKAGTGFAETQPAYRETDDTGMFSRSVAGLMNDARDFKIPGGYLAGDLFERTGKLNWWHKTVGTPFNLARRSPVFARVYTAVQRFIGDVSHFANDAANLAPKILPKLEGWRDLTKSPISAEDSKAIAAPIFEGTLTWGRDAKGKPVKMADLEAAADALDHEAKARAMFKAGVVSEDELHRWQALPIQAYEGAVDNRYSQTYLRAGVVWTPGELRSMFKATDEQIALYKEFRAAVDRSLSNMAISEMLRLGGRDINEALREQALATKDAAAANTLLAEHFQRLHTGDPARAKVFDSVRGQINDLADKARDLQERGYAPLSRFGTLSLDVVEPDGTRAYFGLFDSIAERAKMARQMRANFPGAAVTLGTMSQEKYKLFAGVSPETIELFGSMLGLDAQGDDAKHVAFQQAIKLSTSNRSAMRRLIERKGIAGFSEDAGRVLAGFVYSNGRHTASNLHSGEIDEAVNDVVKEQGELADNAVRLRDYVKNPQEEAQGLRGLMFSQYLGGSIASAIVNATQPFTVTFPWLSQFGGITKAAKQMAAAVSVAGKDTTGDAVLDKALHKAEEDGIVSPQEVHQLQAQASGRGSLKSGDGTRVGDAMAAASNAQSKLTLAWGKVFGVAEQFNRRVTFIAAYRTALEQGMADPAGFAARAVEETQFTYNKGNKPQWARGAIGSVLFTFKQYSINYIELLARMATAGEPGSPERAAGRKAVLLALAVMFLIGGADGLPFASDAEDVIDGILQRLGYNFSTKRAKQDFFASVLGEDGGRFISKGVSGLPGVPIDVSGRMGVGNLIPGTGLFLKKSDHTRDVTELVGPAGDLVKRGFTAAGQLLDADPLGAAATTLPTAGRNVVQAVDMVKNDAYRDQKGRKVIDTDMIDAAFKALGFQPNSVARVQNAIGEVQQMVDLTKLVQSELAAKMATAIHEKDAEARAEVLKLRDRWNENNPENRITIQMAGVLKRVKEMNMTKAERIAKTAPKAMRAEVRKELEAAQ